MEPHPRLGFRRDPLAGCGRIWFARLSGVLLTLSTVPGAVAQSGSAPRSHRGGQGFESPQLHLRGSTRTGQDFVLTIDRVFHNGRFARTAAGHPVVRGEWTVDDGVPGACAPVTTRRGPPAAPSPDQGGCAGVSRGFSPALIRRSSRNRVASRSGRCPPTCRDSLRSGRPTGRRAETPEAHWVRRVARSRDSRDRYHCSRPNI